MQIEARHVRRAFLLQDKMTTGVHLVVIFLNALGGIHAFPDGKA